MADPRNEVPGRATTGLGPIAGETVTDPVGETVANPAVDSIATGTDPRLNAPLAPTPPLMGAGNSVAYGSEVQRDTVASAPAASAERTVGVAGPGNWWRLGLLALAALIIVLGILQMMGGGAGTQTQPGTPVAAPEADAPVTTTPAADAPTPADTAQ